MGEEKKEQSKTNALVEYGEYGYTERELKTIINTVARGATAPELHLFLSVAKLTGLNPFLRQIHFVKRNTKNGPVVSIQTGIDGYRALADDSTKGPSAYGGSEAPVFEWDTDVLGKPKSRFPVSATSVVYRLIKIGEKTERVAVSRTAYWEEYYPGDDNKQAFMWKKMPRTMLGKCAEALALRAAFPLKLSGMYVHEEMEQEGPGPRIVDAEVVDIGNGPGDSRQSEGASELNDAVHEQAEPKIDVELIRRAKEHAANLIEYGDVLGRDLTVYFGCTDAGEVMTIADIRSAPENAMTAEMLDEGIKALLSEHDLNGFKEWLAEKAKAS